MDQVISLLQDAFFTGTNSIEAIVIALVMALIASRWMQVPILALVGLLIDLVLPVVWSLIENGNFDEIGTLVSDQLTWVVSNLTQVALMYAGYLVVIGLLFALKSLLFRR